MNKYKGYIILLAFSILITSCSKPEPVKEETEISQDNINEDNANNNDDVEENIDANDDNNEDQEVGIYPGMKAPEIIAEDRSGEDLKLSDFAGKITFINFWATTCPYCVDEMPDLEEFYNDHKDEDDFALIGINMTKTWEKMSKEDIVNWVDEINVSFPIGYDLSGEIATQWQTGSLPVTFIIDEKGISHGAIMGKTDAKTLEKVLEEMRSEN